MSSKEIDDERLIHSRSDNIQMIITDKSDAVIEEFFQIIFSRYQICLEKTMKGSIFIFNHVHLLHYQYHKK